MGERQNAKTCSPTAIQVVAFTKDWDDVPTCTTHILREMAKEIPVLWVCSIGTRKPGMFSAKDWRRVAGRLAAVFRKAEWKENRLRVLHPVLIPKAERWWSRWFNRLLFSWYLRRELPPHFTGAIEFWCFVPNAVDLLPGRLGTSQKVIYYCVDDWRRFHHLDGTWMAQKEQALLRRSDRVFATSRYLETKLRERVPECGASVVYMPHGVNYARFASALDRSSPLPADMAALPRPLVGFYGNLHPWVDFSLIASLAESRPQWTFFLIGEIYSDVSRLEALANVHLAGRREHSVLPSYCRGFDAAIIPYDMTQLRMQSVNPVKTKELLASGVPVVASAVPELSGYGEDVLLCEGLEEWITSLERQLQRSEEDRRLISERVQGEDWVVKVQSIRRQVTELT